MSFLLVLLVLELYSVAAERNNVSSLYEEVFLHVHSSLGLTIKHHSVTTDDGYILSLYHIPSATRTNHSHSHEQDAHHLQPGDFVNNATRDALKQDKPGKVVFLQHGILNTPFLWLIRPLNLTSWVGMFTSQGYDVWLGSNRGNIDSRGHVNLNWKDSDAYWDFTWDDMASHDIPTMIKFAVNHYTLPPTLWYIGFSQGSTQMFAALSSQPNLSNLIHRFTALSPVINLQHIKLRWYEHMLTDVPLRLLHTVLGHKAFPSLYVTDTFAPLDEGRCQRVPWVCNFLVAHFTHMQNISVADIGAGFVKHKLEVTSVKNIEHWRQQQMRSDLYAFDYGDPELNRKHYHQPSAPRYPLERIEVLIDLVIGTSDRMVPVADVKNLQSRLKKVNLIEVDGFDHPSMIFSRNLEQIWVRLGLMVGEK